MTAGCDHKFVDSTSCIKCGWMPPLLNIVRVETEPPDYQADVIMGVGYFRMPSEEAMSDDLQASAAWPMTPARWANLQRGLSRLDPMQRSSPETISCVFCGADKTFSYVKGDRTPHSDDCEWRLAREARRIPWDSVL